jgi:DNA primase
MGKLAQATSKYIIYAHFEADGTVEKPDVIGAVFGQTEGLLGAELDLRELQRTGRIGRIDVDLKTVNGKTSGTVIIPSSLDSSETALIAACAETIERVGPCNAKVFVEKIEDVRIEKRKYVVDRAKELLGKIFDEGIEDIQSVSEEIKESVRVAEITNYKNMPAGPGIEMQESIIVVEGRADVLNLLKNGIKNVIAIEGTSVPPQLAELTKGKVVTAFLDGDRGGDLILKELAATCEIDFVAKAPRGKEVEELSKKELFKALRDRIPADQTSTEYSGEKRQFREEHVEERKIEIDASKTARFKEILDSLTGTRAAYLLNDNLDVLGKVPLREMFNALRELEAEVLVFDGDIDQKTVGIAFQNGIKYLIGIRISGRLKIPEGMAVLTQNDL